MKPTLLFLSVFLTTALFGQQMTYVPDDNFEYELENLINYDPNWVADDSVETAFLESLTYLQMWVPISDYTGLEAMVNLEQLWLDDYTYTYPQVQALPTLFCPNLTSLIFRIRFYGTVDLSNCPNLENLDFEGCGFSAVNVDGLTSLTFIDAYLSSVYEFDVSSCTALEIFSIDGNPNLSCLNVANGNNTNMSVSWSSIYSSYDNFNLSCVTVDDTVWANENWYGADPYGFPPPVYSLNCGDACSCETIYTQETVTSCESYIWDANGQTYTESGQYTQSLLSQYGCDSIVNLDLTISDVNTSVLQLNEITLESQAINAQYQWLDCNNFIEIQGETNQIFEAPYNGSFAVFVTQNNCSDTSDCINISTLGLEAHQPSKNLIQILDMMGRETTFKPNTPLIYVYDDGSTEKVFTIE